MESRSLRFASLSSLRGVLAPSGRAGQAPFRGHTFSRRQFLRLTAGAAGLVAASGLAGPVFGGKSSLPNPIPGGIDIPPFIHILLPGYPGFGMDPATNDPALITDFNGHIGLAYVRGTGIRTDKETGDTMELPFEVDLRFMKGVYIGEDGQNCNGAFALV